MADLAGMLAKIERRLKRKRCPPSERDEEIYASVRVVGRSQADVAIQYGISPGRVWQVVRRVDEYRADHEPQDDSRRTTFHPSARKQLDWQRLEQIFAMAMNDVEVAKEGLRTRHERHSGPGGPISEVTTRTMLGTGSLRVALRAMELQWQLDDRPQAAPGEARGERDVEFLVQCLVWMREKACGVRRGDQLVRDDVVRWLKALVETGEAEAERAATGCLTNEREPSPLLGKKAHDGGTTGDPPILTLATEGCDISTIGQKSCDVRPGCKSGSKQAENRQIA